MRDFIGLNVQGTDEAQIRRNWGILDYFLRDLSRGVGRIQQGLTPDGSGDTIINQVISDLYWYKPGMPAGTHIAYGVTAPAGNATISSTRNVTKGMVFLGEARQTAYDETNERIGIKKAAPSARLHMVVPDVSGASAGITTASSPGGLDWSFTAGGSVATGHTDALKASGDGKFSTWDASLTTSNIITGSFQSPLTDPGTRTGFKLRVRALATENQIDSQCRFTISGTTGGSIISNKPLYGPAATATGDFVPPKVSTSFAYVEYTFTTAEANKFFDGSLTQPFTWGLQCFGSGTPTGVFQFDAFSLQLPPAGGGSVETLQIWEAASTSAKLDFAADANGDVTLQLSGPPKFRVANTSGMEIHVGSPASGSLLAATDTEGTVTWAAASSVASTVGHSFKGNAYYRVFDDLDGAYIATKAFTLSSVLLYRRAGGNSGSLGVDLRKNGTTVLSTTPSIAFNAGASATASGILSVTSVAVGDRLTAHITAADPRGQDMVLEFQGA